MEVTWKKCNGGHWCDFQSLNLDILKEKGAEGVYIIWYESPVPKTVYVGQGVIADRIANHRKDKRIQKYASKSLRVTRTEVPSQAERDGIERFLGNKLDPIVSKRFPDVKPTEVNIPAVLR